MVNLKPYFQMMLYDLEDNNLEVISAPSQNPSCAADGGKIRIVTNTNPKWYIGL